MYFDRMFDSAKDVGDFGGSEALRSTSYSRGFLKHAETRGLHLATDQRMGS